MRHFDLRGLILWLLAAGLCLPRFAAALPAFREGLSEIGALGGHAGSSTAAALNRHGTIAGTTSTPDQSPVAFLWRESQGLTSLGTLGGAESQASDLNDADAVVGRSLTADGSTHAFIWRPSTGMVDIGPPGTESMAVAISEAGHVAGDVLGDAGFEAFLWTSAGGLQFLGPLDGASTSAVDVNDAGEVIGSYWSEGWRSFYWKAGLGFVNIAAGAETFARRINNAGQVVGEARDAAGGPRAFLWTLSGGMVDLGTLGGPGSSAYAVTGQGEVVGSAGTSAGVEAFLWTASGGMRALGTLGGESVAQGISPNGQIVVGFSRLSTGQVHAFQWKASTGMTDLGAPSGGFSTARGVNNNGRAIGDGTVAEGSFRGLTWDSRGLHDLGSLAGQVSETVALSPAGHVAGFSPSPSGNLHAFLWTAKDGMRDLGDLGGGVSRPVAVNALGHVAGNSLTVDGLERGFFWSAATGILDIGDFGGAQVVVSGMNEDSLVVGMLSYKDAEEPHSRGFFRRADGSSGTLNPFPEGRFAHANAVNRWGQTIGAADGGPSGSRAAMWTVDAGGSGPPQALFDPAVYGGIEAEATRISDSGWIAGRIFLEGATHEESADRGWVRGPDGTVRIVEDAGVAWNAVRSVIIGINGAGDAAGWVTAADGLKRAALWKASDVTATGERGLTPLGVLPGGLESQARGINAAQQVVGFCDAPDGSSRVFLWSPVDGLQDLGTLGGAYGIGWAINDAGQIAGSSTLASGELRAFVWRRSTFKR